MYATYGSRLQAFCRSRLCDRALAEDVVQETFLKAFRSLDGFDPTRPIWPWLRTIAHHLCIDEARRLAHSPLDRLEDEGWEEPSVNDVTSEAVIGAETKRGFERALADLSPRQRRVLLLHLIDGWNYSAIASAEETTVGTVKSIVFRARLRLRAWYREGALGLLLLPIRRLLPRRARARLQRSAEASAVRLELIAPGALEAVGTLANAIVALVVAVSMLGPVSSPAVQVGATVGTVLRPEAARPPSRSQPPATNIAPVDAGVPGSAEDLQQQLLDPGSRATPDNTHFSSIAPSPNYARDHTVFAAGVVPCPRSPCAVAFVSRDGGSSWSRLLGSSFAGTTILLPPGYPGDNRIFATGPTGLQVSEDGGTSFRTLVPITGEAAVSPGFEGSDERILLGTSPVLMDYWANSGGSGVLKPATVAAATQPLPSVAFSPKFLADQTVFVGTTQPTLGSTHGALLERCVGGMCTREQLPASGTPSVRFSSTYDVDGVMAAFTPQALFRSSDRGATFNPLPILLRDGSAITDTSFGLQAAGRSQMLVTINNPSVEKDAALLRSDDGGLTWVRVAIQLPGFEAGASHVVITPDGHILVASALHGMACSTDGGGRWVARC